MKSLHDSNIEHKVDKIVASLARKQKGQSTSDDLDQYSCLPEMINRHIADVEASTVIRICEELLNRLPGIHNKNQQTFDLLIAKLANEAILLTSESHHYYNIPNASMQAWYNTSVKHGLDLIPSMILLSIYIGLSSHEGLLKSQIQIITGYSSTSVTTHLKKLLQDGLIISKQKFGSAKTYVPQRVDVFNDDPSSFINNPPQECWFSTLDPLKQVKDETYSGYLPYRPRDIRNPFIHKKGNTFVFHKRFLHTASITAAILTRGQLNVWLKKVSPSNHRHKIQTFNKQIHKFIAKEFTEVPLEDPHYEQIQRFIPFCQYVGTRQFMLDFDLVQFFIERNMLKLRSAIQDFEVFMVSEELWLGEAPWDVAFFILCIQKQLYWDEWQKRENKAPATFRLLDQSGADKFLTLEKSHLSKDGIKALPYLIRGGSEIFLIVSAARNLNALNAINKNTNQNMTPSLRSSTALLDKITHRQYLVKTSSQNIPKSVRPIFIASENHQFLIVDINSFDLEVWKVLATEHSTDGAVISEGFSFNNLAESLRVERDQVKLAIYAFMYGAGNARVLAETGLTSVQWKFLKKKINAEKVLMDYRDEIMSFAIKDHHTKPTPLGYKMLMPEGEEYKALSWVVQATGAEIFRAWVLLLKDRKLGEYIVNLIHDEIILELPMTLNLYSAFENIQDCLNDAASDILPGVQLTIKGSACRRWDDFAAIKLHLP
jgi:hypothetical protein